jgi:hypothetical protein
MVSKKIILSILLVSFCTSMQAQKYFTKTGITNFKASVDAFEPVAATSNSTTAIVNIADGSIAALLFMKSFHFEVALMEEHFNENYMDSDKFSKGTFRGYIDGFNFSDLSETEKEYTINGTLNIRGIDKEVEAIAKIKLVNGTISLISDFSVTPQDFEIKIPNIVRKKISEQINITLEYEFIEKK